MASEIPGIHHITAIAGDPQRNVDFYVGALGLRMVKRTVNFDDPGTYHLYYGDESGRPGSLLTFFPWPGAPRGRVGTGQAAATSYSIPPESVGFWMDRLKQSGIAARGPEGRFGDQVISFSDPDGLPLELAASAESDPREPWRDGPVPAEHAIRGFHGVTLLEERPEGTEGLLTQTLGFRAAEEDGGRRRFAAGRGGPGAIVDVVAGAGSPRGIVAVGTVHHVAWRAPSGAEQEAWRKKIASLGTNVTPIIDRKYFRSIYFREPGGVLFEIATDAPGFAIDESPERLGMSLVLPPWLEPRRGELEAALPPIRLPAPAVSGTARGGNGKAV
ncbi:MAG TPA: ring-cleaving dioxygenase [Candidatus Eisenbacteria bacterium]|nr:ring-cleaving dioxygenase [Candidatus Eisenbacteria bacterium]